MTSGLQFTRVGALSPLEHRNSFISTQGLLRDRKSSIDKNACSEVDRTQVDSPLVDTADMDQILSKRINDIKHGRKMLRVQEKARNPLES